MCSLNHSSSIRKTLILLVLSLGLCLSCKVKRAVVYQAPPSLPNATFVVQNNEDFQAQFKRMLKEKISNLNYPEQLQSFYEHKNFQPVLVQRYSENNQLPTIISYLENVTQHGLYPELFNIEQIKRLIADFNEKPKTSSKQYKNIIELELLIANALLEYSNGLQFGFIDSQKVYANYFTITAKPDTILMMKVFEASNIKKYLDSIQPKSKQYLALQDALKNKLAISGRTAEETNRVLTVNLERQRWKNKPVGQKMVSVNIANFSLDVLDKGKSILHMKVCVGEGRKIDDADSLANYDVNELKKDEPFTRETPQLSSKIHSVQVNPVWNIPESIARNEISKNAAQDKYYLANNDITVYKNGKPIANPEEINWNSADVTSFSFKQQPGEQNALGKIKFLFNNQSSVYLHDTPVKAAFNQKNRAVSHGCVRVENPLKLAYALFGSGRKYEQIKYAMQSGYPKAKFITLPQEVPIILTYDTAWVDQSGAVQFSKDIYGLDLVLLTHLQKLNPK